MASFSNRDVDAETESWVQSHAPDQICDTRIAPQMFKLRPG
jgi:hypothetical protein